MKLPFVTRKKYENRMAAKDAVITSKESALNVASRYNDTLRSEISRLREELLHVKGMLEVARKNDHRDPKTGRFVKGRDV